jgi:hypothetical protein
VSGRGVSESPVQISEIGGRLRFSEFQSPLDETLGARLGKESAENELGRESSRE